MRWSDLILQLILFPSFIFFFLFPCSERSGFAQRVFFSPFYFEITAKFVKINTLTFFKIDLNSLCILFSCLKEKTKQCPD